MAYVYGHIEDAAVRLAGPRLPHTRVALSVANYPTLGKNAAILAPRGSRGAPGGLRGLSGMLMADSKPPASGWSGRDVCKPDGAGREDITRFWGATRLSQPVGPRPGHPECVASHCDAAAVSRVGCDLPHTRRARSLAKYPILERNNPILAHMRLPAPPGAARRISLVTAQTHPPFGSEIDLRNSDGPIARKLSDFKANRVYFRHRRHPAYVDGRCEDDRPVGCGNRHLRNTRPR